VVARRTGIVITDEQQAAVRERDVRAGELCEVGAAEDDALAARRQAQIRAFGGDRHRRRADRRLVEIEPIDRRTKGNRLAVCQCAELVHGHDSPFRKMKGECEVRPCAGR
jgi:hypothetical protein